MTTKPRLLVHTSRQAIRWADMDMLGHVNNTSYFRYFEQARIEWVYRYADGAGKIVRIDLGSGRSVPLPDVVASRVRELR